MEADGSIPLEPASETIHPTAPVPIVSAAVSVRDVSKSYAAASSRLRRGLAVGRTALDGVTFDVETGKWAALLGPNGSGKSTLFRMLATLDRPDTGTLSVGGFSTTDESDRVRGLLGVVFQRPGLDPMLTVRENLVLQGELCGVSREEATARAATLGFEMGFADRLGDRVKTLSGGLARRVDLARALLPQPRVLLLDEPTSGLDIDARRSFLDLLTERRSRTGLTILMSTHQIDEAERADEVIMLASGRIVAGGTASSLRSAMGGLLVQAAASQEQSLREAGLHIERVTPREVFASGDREAIQRAASMLAAQGEAFGVSSPTLADVYLARTGALLTSDQGAAAA